MSRTSILLKLFVFWPRMQEMSTSRVHTLNIHLKTSVHILSLEVQRSLSVCVVVGGGLCFFFHCIFFNHNIFPSNFQSILFWISLTYNTYLKFGCRSSFCMNMCISYLTVFIGTAHLVKIQMGRHSWFRMGGNTTQMSVLYELVHVCHSLKLTSVWWYGFFHCSFKVCIWMPMWLIIVLWFL